MDRDQEPILDVQDIQGNILAGFNKDFQNLLFLNIVDSKATKTWLRELIPQISSLNEVLRFNNLFKSIRVRMKGMDPHGLAATWVNVAMTFQGLKKLVPEESEQFKDEAFRSGMANRAGLLGDLTTKEQIPENWVIGGPDNLPDILLIVASDNNSYLQERLKILTESIDKNGGLKLIHVEEGRVRSDKPGHEHFGFKDCISQPGIRGCISDMPEDFLSPRFIDPKDERSKMFSRPGEMLIWPGEFVFGYPSQGAVDSTGVFNPILKGADMLVNVPPWARNGSYLVFRRLSQDVADFRNSLKELANDAQLPPDLLGAKFVGRWPSGAPVVRSSQHDDQELGANKLANNHFSYTEAEAPIKLNDAAGGQEISGAPSDFLGKICPFSAHIRKVNPRDFGTDLGSSEQTMTKRILRRGIPYGAPYDQEPKKERGLLFLSYQTSIQDQFEFLQRSWANQKNRPAKGGEDPIIGQNSEEERIRTFDLPDKKRTLSLPKEWVKVTGGDYFFQPSINAIMNVLTK
ncbi:Dyp-type peroxidase [Bacillus wiedmannii]|uniref:Dyp-type peroxidase n=1 Tax=Bacillus wiedmannii TaxID=1890302 RepID=UPI000D088C7A|nr:Dyp-type peroxidase [Bacillus wiedmannii]PRT15101.1 peroxidase [Bacillus wiedmannii]